jgi:glycosyltransferase involved in cell wall biosynthesis
MKILEINKYYYSKRGADKHFVDLIQLLESKGHEVAIFSMHNSKNLPTIWSPYFLSYVGYNSYDAKAKQKIKGIFRMFFSWEARKKINQILDEFQPEVVHIHNLYHQMCPSTVISEIKKRGIPIAMTIHDYKIINPNHSLRLNGKPYERCRDRKYYECFLDKAVKNSRTKSFLGMLEAYWQKARKTYEQIDFFIVPSNFVKKTLIKWGIEAEKISVLPHFSSTRWEKTNPIISDDTENKLAKSEKYALYFGSISREKGIDTLLEIFSKIDGLKLYLAGEMENDYKIIETEKIKLLGHLGQNKLKNYIQNASLVISPSQLPETFGLIALEAISLGKPFVGFNVGAQSEIIKNGENGFLVESKDEMKEIIEKINRREIIFPEAEIRTAAREKYDSEAYHQKLIWLFNLKLTKTENPATLNSPNLINLTKPYEEKNSAFEAK